MGLVNWTWQSIKDQLVFPGAGITDTHRHTQKFVSIPRTELRSSCFCSQLLYRTRLFSSLRSLLIHAKMITLRFGLMSVILALWR